jgi:hypothetical protein
MQADREMGETPAAGALAGRRMLFVAPDDYPAFRVDLTELFSRHLVGRGLSIDWSLYRADQGEAGIMVRGRERFLLPAKLPGGAVRKLRNRLSTGAVRWGLVWRTLRGDYDLVQVRDYTFWGIPFLVAARLAGKPFVYWMSYPVLDARWLLATKPFRPVSMFGRIARLLHAGTGKLVFYRFLRYADHVVVTPTRATAGSRNAVSPSPPWSTGSRASAASRASTAGPKSPPSSWSRPKPSRGAKPPRATASTSPPAP